MASQTLPPLLLLLLLGWGGDSLQERPNFVLMMVDDLGIGDLGCYGNTSLRTPNIDRLAQEGVKLTQHIAAASLCTPGRAAFLTGRYPIRSGMSGSSRPGVFLFTAASGGLPRREVTFAKIAKQRGYETALIGKWHLGLNCGSSQDHCHHPHAHGFSFFFGVPLTNLRDCQPGHGTVFQIHKYLPYGTMGAVLLSAAALHLSGAWRLRRGLLLGLPVLVLVLAGMTAGFVWTVPYLNCVLFRDGSIVEQPFRSENLTQRMTREAVAFMERNSARPFLLFFSFLQVHTAMFASAAFKGSSRHSVYGDAVHEVDWSVDPADPRQAGPEREDAGLPELGSGRSPGGGGPRGLQRRLQRHLRVESLLLHPKLLPRRQSGVFPHPRLFLHPRLRHLPRPPAALRPLQGPLGEPAPDGGHRTGLLGRPGGDGGGGRLPPALRPAGGEPVLCRQADVEALAAALLLHLQAALPVPAGPAVKPDPSEVPAGPSEPLENRCSPRIRPGASALLAESKLDTWGLFLC
ncbi:steryl-sulfatase isoform X3 [Oryzias latipes]